MNEFYFMLVINQRRTCNPENTLTIQVPNIHKADVTLLLEARGYDLDGYRL